MKTLLAAAASPAADLLDVFENYNGGTLFRGLATGAGGSGILGQIGWIFTGFGALFVLWGFVLRSRSAGSGDKSAEIARTWVIIGLMLAGPFMMRTTMGAADGIYQSAIGGPENLAFACVKAAYAMPEVTSLFDAVKRGALAGSPAPAQGGGQAGMVADKNEGGMLGYLEAYASAVWRSTVAIGTDSVGAWGGLMRTLSLLAGFGSAVMKCVLIAAIVIPLYLLLIACGALIWFMGQLRYFLAVMGTMMLPLFVGLFSLPAGHANRQAAQAYVMHMVSLALWPVAWAIGHTGTIALFDALVSLIAGTSRVPDMAAILQWDAISSSNPIGADQVRAMEAAIENWYMGNLSALLGILVGGFGFAVWVLSVSVFGPVFLHRLLSTGAMFMTQALSASGRHAMSVATLGTGTVRKVLATRATPVVPATDPEGALQKAPAGRGGQSPGSIVQGPAGGAGGTTMAEAADSIGPG